MSAWISYVALSAPASLPLPNHPSVRPTHLITLEEFQTNRVVEYQDNFHQTIALNCLAQYSGFQDSDIQTDTQNTKLKKKECKTKEETTVSLCLFVLSPFLWGYITLLQ